MGRPTVRRFQTELPGRGASSRAPRSLFAATPAPADAASHSTCNGNVCHDVDYSGNYVSQWRGLGYGGTGYSCHYVRFWVNDGFLTSRHVCGTRWVTAYGPQRTYPADAKLCVSVSGFSGYSCMRL